MSQSNPKITYVALNNNAGVFTVIRLSTFAKYVEIVEDPGVNAGVGQGLQGNILDPFAQSANITAGMVPAAAGAGVWPAPVAADGWAPQITFGARHALGDWPGLPIGNPGSAGNVDNPGGTPTLGTPLCQLRSNTATATQVIVREWVS